MPRSLSRLVVLAGAVALVPLAPVASSNAAPAPASAPTTVASPASADAPIQVGRGVGDVTGAAAENGMMGYGRFDQQTSGMHTRLWSRAFVFVDAEGNRVVHATVDTALMFDSVRQEVLRRLQQELGDKYDTTNVMLTATHTHASTGGTSHHLLYNVTTGGFHEEAFESMVTGIVESIVEADADVAPTDLRMSEGDLKGASINRSLSAFEKNPQELQEKLPGGIDTSMDVLSMRRDGDLVGAMSWFAVHPTSMSGDNTLISGDNKGYASQLWERRESSAPTGADGQDFVAAFPQPAGADSSPNMDLKPGTTPEDFGKTEENGRQQADSASKVAGTDGDAVTGQVDSILQYVDLGDVEVSPEFSGTGKAEHTCRPVVGAAMAAGSTEDGPAFPGFSEGDNPFWKFFSDIGYSIDPEKAECQAPKDSLVDLSAFNDIQPFTQEKLPVQIMRIGDLRMVGMPVEVTAASGQLIKEQVAQASGVPEENVIVNGVTNSYSHYLTTPQEYEAQEYEGGSTLFGKYELPAYLQTLDGLARKLESGEDVEPGSSPDLRDRVITFKPGVVLDVAGAGHQFGDVLEQPQDVVAGEQAKALFVGAHPRNDLKNGDTFLKVQRKDGDEWTTVATDNDWSTKFHWKRHMAAQSRVTITWDVPQDADPGEYRIVYYGDSRPLIGKIEPFTGTTQSFTVG